MVASNIEQEIRGMSDEALDAKVVQMLREAAQQLQKLADENAKLWDELKKYGRHTRRCGWQQAIGCDCGLDDALKEPDSE